MIPFDPQNPFPLVAIDRSSERERKDHAAAVDLWLGLRTQSIETQLLDGGCRIRPSALIGDPQELWLGLDIQTLLTPYVEIRELLNRLAPRAGETIVDLGAAYGRMGFVIARHHPQVSFVGYEFVGERVIEGRKALARFNGTGSAAIRIEHSDLAARRFVPTEAEAYFIYDYGNLKAVEKTLYDLRRIAGRKPIKVVARGRHVRYLIAIRHPWLAPANQDGGENSFTIYSSFESDSVTASELRAS